MQLQECEQQKRIDNAAQAQLLAQEQEADRQRYEGQLALKEVESRLIAVQQAKDELEVHFTAQQKVKEEAERQLAAQQKANNELEGQFTAQQKAKEEIQRQLAAQQKANIELEGQFTAQQKAKHELERQLATQQRAKQELNRLLEAEQRVKKEIEGQFEAETRGRSEAEREDIDRNYQHALWKAAGLEEQNAALKKKMLSMKVQAQHGIMPLSKKC